MCESCGCGQPVPGHREGRVVDVRRDVLSHNAAHAAANRARLDALGVISLNVIGSPGAGKTTLLEALIGRLSAARPVFVIEGDLQTSRDADRIAATGAHVHQINTGEGCHLDAHQVAHALESFDLPRGAILVIENVGNLVCPAAFDLGESRRVVVLSTPEGDDKVEKYPIAFRGVDAVVISKVDLLEHVDFSVERATATIGALEPKATVIPLSARSGAGMDTLVEWVLRLRPAESR